MIKAIFDYLVAWIIWILLSPFLLLIGVLVKVDSPGPILYRGLRIGQDAKPFRIYKFRTMAVNAEQLGGGTTALNDPRITRLGKILRSFKLDELPQLINVIVGDMSLVGPRPELPYYTQQYTEEEEIILSVKPGITDLSSIAFSSLDKHVGSENADRVFEEIILPVKNQLRIKYAGEHHFMGDIKILFDTMKVIIKKLIDT